jgi:regulator of protease activity HflC (stomatin/prohibitin superfamily)
MTSERAITAADGWGWLFVNLTVLTLAPLLFIGGFAIIDKLTMPGAGLLLLGMFAGISAIVMLCGHFTLQPNEACVLSFFGPYVGTVRSPGFYWVNPFYTKKKISLRVRNFDSAKLKVNDKQGNPIEIGAVVVWHVADTAQATFDVENYEEYVKVQSEAALRHLANSFAYDHGEANEVTLRCGVEEVSSTLKAELQARLAQAGVTVDEARLSHLAYAPEIAGVMLRRQQAEAVIAARQKIVHGAVSMVDMAIRELQEREIVALDADRKSALVSNLLVVLCSEAEAQPVIHTGATANA